MSGSEISTLTLGLINASNNIKYLNNNIRDLSNNLAEIDKFLEDIYTKLDYDDNKFNQYLVKLQDLSNNIG